jgi:hypothetical protein
LCFARCVVFVLSDGSAKILTLLRCAQGSDSRRSRAVLLFQGGSLPISTYARRTMNSPAYDATAIERRSMHTQPCTHSASLSIAQHRTHAGKIADIYLHLQSSCIDCLRLSLTPRCSQQPAAHASSYASAVHCTCTATACKGSLTGEHTLSVTYTQSKKKAYMRPSMGWQQEIQKE